MELIIKADLICRSNQVKGSEAIFTSSNVCIELTFERLAQVFPETGRHFICEFIAVA
jgi:hypothetical protein